MGSCLCKEVMPTMLDEHTLINIVTVDMSEPISSEPITPEPYEKVNEPYPFEDILDEKHQKYMHHFSSSELFWGIGIENETYLMQTVMKDIKAFRNLKQKRERYSVDYYKSFTSDALQAILQKMVTFEKLMYPVYINSHTFQATDIHQEHRTIYDVHSTPNSLFTESIHDQLIRDCPYYKDCYGQSLVFDGDSIEFITQKFYCGTVDACVDELVSLKNDFLKEIAPFFSYLDTSVAFPDHNYGIVSFLTTKNQNLALCNNGTYHINLTLPTMLRNGTIIHRQKFVSEHMNLISCLQIIEPLIVACYGTPDVFSIVNPVLPSPLAKGTALHYAMGSLRCRLSRYISLQTYDVAHPINGKLMHMDKPTDPAFWQNLFPATPYVITDTIGYDMNFNKFKNHGIELRFLDWFPEIYLTDLLHFFILVAQHSLHHTATWDKSNYNTIIMNCVQKGFTYRLSQEECNRILEDLGLPLLVSSRTAHELLSCISDQLYVLYADADLIKKMSPGMKKPVITNYNYIAFQALHRDLFGKPDLIIRAEINELEERVPIIPNDIDFLKEMYTIFVESSKKRCYTDDEYLKKGATIVKKDHWLNMKNAYVLGIKGIEYNALKSQTHLHFSHSFKQQEGYQERLRMLRNSVFIDYEYIVNTSGKRVISFCGQSGKIGCYLALMAYYNKCTKRTVIPPFHEETYRMILSSLKCTFAPSVLLIGYGTVGKACKAVLDQLGISYTIWTSKQPVLKQVILEHSILIHAIRLNETACVEPFLVTEDLKNPGNLSVICDISCDLGHSKNTLPIYGAFTTAVQPVVQLTDKIDLIALPYLPSLEPHLSSELFSAMLTALLPELLYFQHTLPVSKEAAMLYGSYQKFLLQSVC